MRAIAIRGEGEAATIHVSDMAIPVPAAGEVLIRVVAASVNRPDVQQRRGLYPPPPGASPILGLDVSGIVVAAADDVRWPRPGDSVCALVNGGGYADYCRAPAGQCLPLPAGLGFIEAASLPEAYFTAWNALMNLGRLGTGEALLYQGGASGVGLAAIQIAARLRGARIVATASSAMKRDLCLAAGAAHAIDYRDAGWEAQARDLFGGGCDVIVDAQAGPTSQPQLDLLADGGRLVLLASHAGAMADVNTRFLVRRQLTLTGGTLRPRSPAYKAALASALRQHVWPLIEAGRIRTHICATFPLERAMDAHRELEANRQIGKIVLILDPEMAGITSHSE
ncbi:NAD(P)H-quinone oxidoreductase [Sphingomonas sp.]|uniref:NAD(P)H-quinone oxidoreductase n=1 Tax=Sphingomonas sp. TaxID=28214 RepID=UPI000DB68468|nr:NAD(P)H-quinone oxidoreductase [Sphingomonas sp.]PZU08023.1 MAG: NAD(P)H-quinone oxidoreductase [Sphingomonas sp.]